MTKTVTEIHGVRVEEGPGYVRCFHADTLREFRLTGEDAEKWKVIREGATAMGALETFLLNSIVSLGKVIH